MARACSAHGRRAECAAITEFPSEFFTMKDMKSMKIRNPNSCPSSPLHVLHALHGKNQVPCFFLALSFLSAAYPAWSAVN